MRIFSSTGRWFGRTVAGGVVEGFAFLAVVSLGLSLWSWLKGATFEQAALLGLVAIVLLALSFYFVSLAVARFQGKPLLSHEIKAPAVAQDIKLHENCERIISNHESTIRRLRDQNETQGIQISSRDTRIEQLESRIAEMKWLSDIGDEQGATIHRFVSIERCELGKFELYQRNDPYIEFRLAVWNRSVYDIELKEPRGLIEYQGRQLTGPLKWKESTRIVTWSNQSWFTLRQDLSPDDVAFILNGSDSRFRFELLELGAKGNGISDPKVLPQPLTFGTKPPNNENLLRAYPKIEFSILGILASFIVNLAELGNVHSDAFVNIETLLKNERQHAVVIDSVTLTIIIKGTRQYTAAAEFGNIWEKRFVNEAGEPATSGKKLTNLADRLPLRMLQDAHVSGSFQFIFRGVGAAILSPTSYRLTVTDANGEQHSIAGVFNAPITAQTS